MISPVPLGTTQANADLSVINCMHNLSRRIAIALQHEELRCQYLTREAKLMLAVQEEITTVTESETHTSQTFVVRSDETRNSNLNA